jgi:tetratricopeptide (TPR) repeat protein
MESELATLSQTELLALALEATRRGDSGHSMAYLKEASARGDASEQAHFLLGSEYAQIGLMDQARQHFQRAVDLNAEFSIARFQLGLLQLTNAQPEEALSTWSALSALGSEHPLEIFHLGMQHLIRDEFVACLQCLERGIALNTDNPALNTNMQLVIERVKGLVAYPADPASVHPQADEGSKHETESHLFLNAYTGGKGS